MGTPAADKLRHFYASKYLVADGGAIIERVADAGGAADHNATPAAIGIDAAIPGDLGAGVNPEDPHANEASISFSLMSTLDHTCWMSSRSSSAPISFNIC